MKKTLERGLKNNLLNIKIYNTMKKTDKKHGKSRITLRGLL